MTTSFVALLGRLGLTAALGLVAAGAATAGSPPASQNRVDSAVDSSATHVAYRPPTTPVAPAAPVGQPGPYTYAWPLKPFRHQHPVRGFFGDPRISNHGESRQFHFGIDISAPNGTAVYATLDGTAYVHSLHSTTIDVVGADGVEFSYWHIVPTIRSGQRVVAYKTVIGRIEEPWGHVHFSEKRAGRYVNPLRRGALGPFVDDTTPAVRSARVRDGLLVVESYDETPLAVPRPWHDLPVMPALVRWRLLDRNGRVVRGWATAVDFRLTIPDASAFDGTWASGVSQNHVRTPGRYVLALTGSNDLRGRYQVEIAASDTRGNATRVRFQLRVTPCLPTPATRTGVRPVPRSLPTAVGEALVADGCAVGARIERDGAHGIPGEEGTMRQVTRMHRTLVVLAVGLLALAAPLVASASGLGPGGG